MNLFWVVFLAVGGSSGGYFRIKAGQPVVTKLSYDEDTFVASAMLDGNAKCGDITSARTVFYQSPRFHDVVLYNAMIICYAHHGLGLEALDMFGEMKEVDLQPNQAKFVSIISAVVIWWYSLRRMPFV
ncbi:unnamed protein product [Linum trigynum]|uniref:Pentatricopeptide repeat-containing protein n=1 Tax=Linum trigynum TaxID=586398 RepID=A0AAV2DN33_9ROSI